MVFSNTKRGRQTVQCCVVTGICGADLPFPARSRLLVYLAQHVGAHATLGWMFGASLRPGRTPLCTEFASWGHWRMTPQLVWYTQQVTRVWMAFFADVAAVSLALFAAASPAAWMLFSSVLGPLLTAALFVVENLARRRYLPPDNRMGLMAT